MKKCLPLLLILGLLWVPPQRFFRYEYRSGRAWAATKSSGGYLLPVVTILASLGLIWYGAHQRKKQDAEREAQSRERAARRESALAKIPFEGAQNFDRSDVRDVRDDNLGPPFVPPREEGESAKTEGSAPTPGADGEDAPQSAERRITKAAGPVPRSAGTPASPESPHDTPLAKGAVDATTPAPAPEAAANDIEEDLLRETFAGPLVTQMQTLFQSTLTALNDLTQLKTEARSDASKIPDAYQNKMSPATNMHVYWALKNAGCDMAGMTPDNVHTTAGWQSFFQNQSMGRDKIFNNFIPKSEEPPATALVLEKWRDLPTGCVVVYDCSPEEAKKFPAVEVVGPRSPLPADKGAKSHMNVINVSDGVIQSQQRCQKVAGIYLSMTPYCQFPVNSATAGAPKPPSATGPTQPGAGTPGESSPRPRGKGLPGPSKLPPVSAPPAAANPPSAPVPPSRP